MKKAILEKNFYKFKEKIDFNYISKILENGNFESMPSSNWLNCFIFDSVFRINKVHTYETFIPYYNFLNKKFNPKNLNADLDIFFSMITGSKSITHKDIEDVYILGVLGNTLYKIDNSEEYLITEGDLIYIPKNTLHKAISMTPRIVLSCGIY